jgi:hypothetical protein
MRKLLEMMSSALWAKTHEYISLERALSKRDDASGGDMVEIDD